MNFLNYIKGDRKGREAHRIEKDSMTDPFLYEAIEGFDNVKGDHIQRIDDLRKQITAKSKQHNHRHIWQTVAAAIVLIVAMGGYFLSDYHKTELHAQELSSNAIIEVYVPEVYYSENITVIAKKNSELIRAYKPNISRFKVEQEEISNEELKRINKELSKESYIPIEIYVPEDFDRQAASGEEQSNKKPEPIGGYEQYEEYLKRSLKRPTDDICRDRKGKVVVEFSVNSLGQPFLFDVKQSLCGTSDNEAIRLIQNGPKWTAGSKERVRVRVIF